MNILTLFRLFGAPALLTLLVGSASSPALATVHNDDLVVENAESVGFSSERLRRLDAMIQRAVDDKQYAGVVTLVARHGKIVHLQAIGHRDVASGAAMTDDTIFRINSMTKLITGVAMMTLYEEGKWNPQDPVFRFIPQFSHLKVYKGLDTEGHIEVEDPAHPPTMRELMTHTAGFSGGGTSSPVDKMYRGAQDRDILLSGSLQEMIDRLANAPLLYQPSSQWVYSISMDIQGYIIEKLSGMPLQDFMKQRIFDPLRMHDTAFYVPKEKRSRFATLYTADDRGTLTPTEGSAVLRYDRPPTIPLGGAGLVSTVVDYFRFAQMLLNGGILQGVRILGPETVKLMMSNHIPETLMKDFQGGGYAFSRPRPGFGYGFDGGVVTDPGAADVPMGKGSYFWNGAAGTWVWIDPSLDIVVVGMLQRLGWGMNFGSVPNLEEGSRAVVYQALTKPDL